MGASFRQWCQRTPDRILLCETLTAARHVRGRREQAAAVHGNDPSTPWQSDLFEFHFRGAARASTPELPASVHDHDGRYRENEEQGADYHAAPCEETGDGLDEESPG